MYNVLFYVLLSIFYKNKKEMYIIKQISYYLTIVKQFILTQFKYPYYVIYIFLTTDTKVMGSTCFYSQSENSPGYVINFSSNIIEAYQNQTGIQEWMIVVQGKYTR